MKLLLSAYACEPGKGSEPGIGWHWALETARLGHEVWVLTRANNRPSIERGLADLAALPNLHFVYFDLPGWARRWKRGSRGIHLYYLLWQWGAYRLARRLHANEHFERVHHITFGTVRQPSFMGGLGIPFIFGPVAGGERAPWRLRFGYGPRGWLLDALRDLLNLAVRLDPLMRRTFRQAERIYVTSEQCRALLPARYRAKAHVQLAIGYDSGDVAPAPDAEPPGNHFRVLYVGRFLYWKGMHLSLAAFAFLLQQCPDASLTMVGKGPDEARWRRLAQRLGIAARIEWVPWLDRDALAAIYDRHDLLLFPSLHDSGGMAVLEAMSHGLPVVCLDLGGPGIMVDEICGRAIATGGASKSAVIDGLARALTELAKDPELRRCLGAGARARAGDYDWAARIGRIYSAACTGQR